MAKIRQLTAIHPSATYTDGTAPTLANFQTNPTNLEENVNNLRSAVNNILSARAGNWYDDPFSGGGGAGGTNDIPMSGLNQVPIGCFTDLLTDVPVSNGQNWEILNVSALEAASIVGSLADTTEGAIVAASAFSAGSFDAFELVERTGSTAVSPNNLLIIRDSTTGQQIQSDGRDVFGLLQVESTFTDGNAFDDISTGDRVKISFVRLNTGLDDLEAVPVADIEDKVINYNYPSVVFFKNLDPSCFGGNRGFIDQAASVDVTLQNAYTTGPLIVTSGNTINFSGAAGAGGFSVSMVDAVAIGVAAQTASNTAGNTLTLTSGDGLGTGDGGAASVTAGDSGTGATGDGGAASLIAGAATSTLGAGGAVIITAGDSTGSTAGGNIVLTSGASVSGANGFVSVLSAADNDEALMLFTPSGTAATVGFYSGSVDPNTVTTATRGSVYMRNTGATGEVWVNTNNATAWTQLQAGAAVVTLEAAWSAATGAGATLGASGFTGSIADTDSYVINTATGSTNLLTLAPAIGADAITLGNTEAGTATTVASGTGGTSVSSTAEVDLTAGTTVDINAGTTVTVNTANATDASGNGITLTSGNSTAGNAAGAPVTINTGDGFGTGAGGALGLAAGNAGATGTGGGLLISSGDGGATTGGGGVVQLTAGAAPTSGNGGNIELRAGAGTSDNGRVTVTPNFANADTDEYITFVATGSNPPNSGGTEDVRMLAGGRDPDSNVSATPGSLYLRGAGATSQLYVNTTSGTAPGTTWSPAGVSQVAPIFYQGEVNTGISANGDVSNQAGASNITLDTNSPTFPTFPATAALFFSKVKVWVDGMIQRNGIDVVRSGTQGTAIRFPLLALIPTDLIQIEVNQF